MNPSQTNAHSGRVVAILAAAGITAAVTQTLVVPLIGGLPQILGTSAANSAWVVTVTLLAAAVATPVAGRLGDMFGKRRMLLISLVPLIIGSIVCALSSSLVPMIVGRGLQGLGMGIVPLGISLLRVIVPPEKLGSSVALMSASLGVGGALGLPFASAVAQGGNWRVLFWIMGALAAIVAALVIFFVPSEPSPSAGGRFDFLGAIGLGAALVCLLLAVSKGSGWGWTSGTTLGLFVAAAVLTVGWGFWELRTGAPLVDLRVTARPQVLLTNVASVLVGFAMYVQSLVMPQLLQLPEGTGYGLGQTMLAMGLWMAPAGVMMMVISPVGAKLSAARGPKFTLTVGSLIIATGYASSWLLMGSTWGVLLMTMIGSSGVGFAYGAMPALIMNAVPVAETASANSFNTLMRSIGTSVSAAVVGVVLAQFTTDYAGHAVPTESGFHITLTIGAVVALLAAAVATTIPVKRAVTAADDDAAAAKPGDTQHLPARTA